MSKKPLPSPELLRKLLRYEYATGLLFWRKRTPDMFKNGGNGRIPNAAWWNNRWAGEPAFTSVNAGGYLVGAIYDKKFYAHRVIWAMETNEWPVDQIDHEDHDKSNNRWVNLSEATNQENQRNVSMSLNNTSGYVGVTWNKRRNKWQAQIMVDRKNKSLGFYDCIDDAAAARAAANDKYNFHPNHGISL